MIKDAIIKLCQKKDLTFQEAQTVMDEIMEGEQRMYKCQRI